MSYKGKSLVVIITRILDVAEWASWGFDKEYMCVFLDVELKDISCCKKIKNVNFAQQFETKSAWVINGDFLPRVAAIYDRAEISNQSREYIVYVHTGANSPLLTNEHKQIIRNESDIENPVRKIKKFTQNFITYGLDGAGIESSNCTVAKLGKSVKERHAKEFKKFLNNLRNKATTQSTESYDSQSLETQSLPTVEDLKVFEANPEEPASEYEDIDISYSETEQFSTLKHRLIRLFAPLSIDLQGWKDSGYSDALATEIANQYTKNHVKNILHEAQKTVLKIRRTVEKYDSESTEAIDRLDSGLLEDDKEPRRTLMLVLNINKETVKRTLKSDMSGVSQFHYWFSSLRDQLENINIGPS